VKEARNRLKIVHVDDEIGLESSSSSLGEGVPRAHADGTQSSVHFCTELWCR
jgi:hypothetical protein